MTPITIWLDNPDTISVRTKDSEIIQIPANEPSRLVAFLRNEYGRELPKAGVLSWRNGFANSFEPDDKEWHRKIREDGAKRRAREDERKAKEKEKLIKQAVKRQASKDAEDFFKSIGL